MLFTSHPGFLICKMRVLTAAAGRYFSPFLYRPHSTPCILHGSLLLGDLSCLPLHFLCSAAAACCPQASVTPSDVSIFLSEGMCCRLHYGDSVWKAELPLCLLLIPSGIWYRTGTGWELQQEVFKREGPVGQKSQSTGWAMGGLAQCVLRMRPAIADTYRR